jgi:hypothetical protein
MVDQVKQHLQIEVSVHGENKANRRLQQKYNKEEIDTHHSQEVQEAQHDIAHQHHMDF